MKYICPLLVVSDMEISRAFYERLLRQKVKADFGENITFEGDFSLHLKQHYSSLIDNEKISFGANNAELYFEHDDVDGIADVLSTHEVEFVHPVREQPWRQKVVRIYDPDRHIIEIGESMENLCLRLFREGKTDEEVSQITYMPIEFVKSIGKDPA
jgi:catechol 2,3-dioxygenase-like lactoylglutathione lyase family enzyme